MPPDPSPPLVTPALTLRAFTPADAPAIFRLSREDGLRAWLPDQVYADEEEARGVLRYLVACYDTPGDPARGPIVLAVCLNGTAELIGHVGLSPWRGEVEVGYAIGAAFQGRGHATEALRAACGWGMPRFGLKRIVGIVAAANGASVRVLERAGFELAAEAPGLLHGRQEMVRTYRLE